MAADVERIDVSTARTETAQGRALLVCGYEDDAKCRKGPRRVDPIRTIRIDGADPAEE